ncbi:MAG: sugar ABC transporter permease, partial [Candidatus Zixiibacteriota bacterium]
MRRHRLTSFFLGLPWLVTLGLFWAFPVVYSFIISLTDYRLLSRQPPRWTGLENYTALFHDTQFLQALKTTFVFVIGTVPVTTVIALLLALLVNRQFRGRTLFRAGFFLPSITSMVVIALIFTNLYQRGGYLALLAQMLGIPTPEYGFLYSDRTALPAIMGMDIWMSSGYYMLIFLAGLKAIPEELYEAAEIAGASAMRRFFSITLPLLRPVA